MAKNEGYHESLFGEYRDRKVRGKNVPCAEVRKLIREEKVPKLPTSKGSSDPMCLAWHVKGFCNKDCPLQGDHGLVYTVGESRPLASWCAANWPKE